MGDSKEQSDSKPISDDWFLPAIVSDGNVRESLNSVSVQLERRLEFVRQLKASLSFEDANLDRLTVLGRQVKELENTLRFRLGILPLDRTASWFREAQSRDFGPFRSAMIMAPVFLSYLPEKMPLVKSMLYDAWTSKPIDRSVFERCDEHKTCLWFVLIEQKNQFEQLLQLSGPFRGLSLEYLPELLPEDLESKALSAYLARVKLECMTVRDRLNICFNQLWSACERFWVQQQKTLDEQKRKQNQQSSQQRRSTEAVLLHSDIEALRFMGFIARPSQENLRKRYLELAKTLHPDVNGGKDDSFKMLGKAYHRLRLHYKSVHHRRPVTRESK